MALLGLIPTRVYKQCCVSHFSLDIWLSAFFFYTVKPALGNFLIYKRHVSSSCGWWKGMPCLDQTFSVLAGPARQCLTLHTCMTLLINISPL